MGEPLRLDTELSNMGVSDPSIELFNAQRTTSAEGLIALRRGVIDAARVLVDGVSELHTSEDVRSTEEYDIGFRANSTIIMGRMAA